MSIKLELELEEIKGILQLLGDLPTKSNAWILIQKITQQAEPQMPTQEQEQENA